MQWIKNNQQALKNGALGLLVVVIAVILIGYVNRKNKEEETFGLRVGEMMEFSKAGYTYSFDGVKWIFDTSSPSQTKVNFTFDNFSRRTDKTPVEFKVPFYAKYVDGTCVEATELPAEIPSPFKYDEACEESPLVALAQCGGAVDPTWITIHQCGERLVVSEKNSEKWDIVRTLNITKIVE